MACPWFEPRHRAADPRDGTARLSLLFEFEGVCHAGDGAMEPEHRFRYCNQGNAKGHCASFPPDAHVSALRFNITARTGDSLRVLVVEEENYWPRAWRDFEFMIQDSRLVPEIEDVCQRAQVFQFCRSYLDKF